MQRDEKRSLFAIATRLHPHTMNADLLDLNAALDRIDPDWALKELLAAGAGAGSGDAGAAGADDSPSAADSGAAGAAGADDSPSAADSGAANVARTDGGCSRKRRLPGEFVNLLSDAVRNPYWTEFKELTPDHTRFLKGNGKVVTGKQVFRVIRLDAFVEALGYRKWTRHLHKRFNDFKIWKAGHNTFYSDDIQGGLCDCDALSRRAAMRPWRRKKSKGSLPVPPVAAVAGPDAPLAPAPAPAPAPAASLAPAPAASLAPASAAQLDDMRRQIQGLRGAMDQLRRKLDQLDDMVMLLSPPRT
jgi:hypothetical protein